MERALLLGPTPPPSDLDDMAIRPDPEMSETFETSDTPVPGVRQLDHTADVGLDIDASDFSELLRRAALGMAWLLTETQPPDPAETDASERHTIEVSTSDAPSLLRAWLREILARHTESGFVPARIDLRVADPESEGDRGVGPGRTGGRERFRATATVRGHVPDAPPVREIKGVTFHELMAERRGKRWRGRIVFDV